MTGWIKVKGARIHNLKNIDIEIPKGKLTVITGVSGSGKSSLIADTLVPKLKEELKSRFVADEDVGKAAVISTAQISGVHNVRKCFIIDQKPIGRNSTSCPATYTGMFDRIRNLFAGTPEAVARGFGAGMFSPNATADGKCPNCNGIGIIQYHVGFNNFMEVDCEECGKTGFNTDSLTITVDGKNIRNVLDMSISSAMEYFKDKDKTIGRMLKTLDRVGLGYMTLGQKTPTISGGEAQRIKLAKELGKSNRGNENIFILDEPTTGLSFSDVEKLLCLMQELVEMGNTVIVTEHDPAVLSYCDYIIEMGPGGGSDGGYLIATGTPAELKNNEKSIIGRYLK